MTNFERTSTKPGLEHRGLADGGVGVAKEPSQSAFPAPVICITTPCNLQPLVSRNSKATECCLSACSKTFACLHRHIKSTGIDDDLAASQHPLLGMGALNAVERGWAAKPPPFAVVTLPCQMDTKKMLSPPTPIPLDESQSNSRGSNIPTGHQQKMESQVARDEARATSGNPPKPLGESHEKKKREQLRSSHRITARIPRIRPPSLQNPLTQSKITSKNRQPHSVETNASLLSPRENADRRVGDAGFVFFFLHLSCEWGRNHLLFGGQHEQAGDKHSLASHQPFSPVSSHPCEHYHRPLRVPVRLAFDPYPKSTSGMSLF